MSIIQKIKGKSFLDLFWSFSDNILQQVINFVVGIILARILLPEEFGLIGIITVFIAISIVFVDGGFSAALINKKEVTDVDYNTVFYTNISISCFVYLIIFLSADWIAAFFKIQQIADLLRILGINILLISLSSIHRTIIVRNLNFKIITFVSIVAVSISAVCAIYMAYHGYGVYSLVFRVLIGEVVTIILFWYVNKWRPSFLFSTESFKSMFSYGINLFLSNLLNTLNTNIYYIVIGKFFSASQLGYFTRATAFRDLSSTNISNTIKRVSFSTLSKIFDKKEQIRKFNFFVNITFLSTCFSMLLLFFGAKEIILILLDEKWLPSVEILKIMSISGVFLALYNQNLDYLAVLGKTKRYLTIEIFGKFLVIPIIFVGIVYGFKIFLFALVVQNLLMFLIVLFQLNFIESGFFSKQIKLILEFAIMFFILFIIDQYYPVFFLNMYVTLMIKFSIVLLLVVGFNFTRLKNLMKK